MISVAWLKLSMNDHCKESSEEHLYKYILLQISVSLGLTFSVTTNLLTDLLLLPYFTTILIARDHYIFHTPELQLRGDSLTSVE